MSDDNDDDGSSIHRSSNISSLINLGKPSLRRRLEDYYKLIAPDQISDSQEWQTKFKLIYDKFGGSHEGERALAFKLAKKYGTTVRLLLAEAVTSTSITKAIQQQSSSCCHDEEWYATKPVLLDDISFTSPTFDPMAALYHQDTDETSMQQINPSLSASLLLDNISKFPHYLPDCDPLHRTATTKTSLVTNCNLKRPPPSSILSTIAESHSIGPLSVLYKTLRQRIVVITRNIHGIRGRLTGQLLGFDAHFNLFLKDAVEVVVVTDNSSSNNNHEGIPRKTKRQLRRILVRGDTVVLCYPYRPGQAQQVV